MDEIVSDSEAGGNNTAVLWVIWQMSLERAWRERTGDNAVTCDVIECAVGDAPASRALYIIYSA